jgi:hypothetical protein
MAHLSASATMRSRCDRCHAERVVPERVRRMLEREAKREGNGGAL